MEQCGSHINQRHVYTIINENRNGFKVLIEQKYRINTNTNEKRISDSSFGSGVSAHTSLNASETEYTKKVKVILSAKQWLKMTPKKKDFRWAHLLETARRMDRYHS